VRLQKNKCFEADQRKIAAEISRAAGFYSKCKAKGALPGQRTF
jgi:hypothetical protein